VLEGSQANLLRRRKRLPQRKRSNPFDRVQNPEKLLIVGVQLHQIGPESLNELTEAADLFDENFRGPVEPTRRQVIDLVKNKVFKLFVLKKHDLPSGKCVAGMVLTSTYGQNTAAHIEYLAISNECQGKGLGSLLVKSLSSQLYQKNVRRDKTKKSPHLLTLECTKNLIPFYKRANFELSPLPPMVWTVEHDGIVSPVEYFFMGVSIDPDFGTSELDNLTLMFNYREMLKNSSDAWFNYLPR